MKQCAVVESGDLYRKGIVYLVRYVGSRNVSSVLLKFVLASFHTFHVKPTSLIRYINAVDSKVRLVTYNIGFHVKLTSLIRYNNCCGKRSAAGAFLERHGERRLERFYSGAPEKVNSLGLVGLQTFYCHASQPRAR
jgi:hypothetical protein